MAHFNVLLDPWIPVERFDGSQTELGIISLLKDAEKFRRINCSFPLETAAIARLLAAFLTDAYHLKNLQERRELFHKGRFDTSVLEEYVCRCAEEGDSFDLFDQKRPFMQSAYSSKLDHEKEIRSVAVIVLSLPSGTNHVHFNHKSIADIKLTYKEALRALCAYYAFSPAGGSGYSTSVNGKPCVIFLPNEDNLFRQLVLCMLSVAELGNIPMDNPPAAWRDSSALKPKERKNEMSFLSAMTWRTRRVTFLPDENSSTVSKMYYQPGPLYERDSGLWRDPYVAYLKSKKGDWFPRTPDVGRSLWRDIGTLTAASSESGSIAPLILRQAAMIYQSESSLIRSNAFAFVTDKASRVEIQYDSLSIPSRFLEDDELGEWLKTDIMLAESVVSKSLSSYQDVLGKEVVTELEKSSFMRIRSLLFSEYLSDLAQADTESFEWQLLFKERWAAILKSVIKEAVKEAEQREGSSIRNMISITCASDKCWKTCCRMLK